MSFKWTQEHMFITLSFQNPLLKPCLDKIIFFPIPDQIGPGARLVSLYNGH